MKDPALRSTGPAPGMPLASRPWLPVVAAALLWFALALSVGYWALLVWGTPAPQTLPVPPANSARIDPQAVARALGAQHTPAAAGATPATPAALQRYVLLGVVTSGPQRGAALIAVNGQAARPFRVGTEVDEGLVLRSVRARAATLGPKAGGPESLELELPEPR